MRSQAAELALGETLAKMHAQSVRDCLASSFNFCNTFTRCSSPQLTANVHPPSALLPTPLPALMQRLVRLNHPTSRFKAHKRFKTYLFEICFKFCF